MMLGLVLFGSGVSITAVFLSYLTYIDSAQLDVATFPPNEEVSDSCSITDFGYLSLKAAFREQRTNFKVSIPTRVLIQGPDNKAPFPHSYEGEINSFYGSKPPGTYTVTITSLEDENNRIVQNAASISYNLECMTKSRYDLGQTIGGLLALANVMYLIGFPIMIYGVIKERKLRIRQAIAAGYWKAQVQGRRQSRPLGVSLLAIESIVAAGIVLVGSLIFAALSVALNSSPTFRAEIAILKEDMPFPFSELDFGGVALILLIAGIIAAIQGYGLRNAKRWAWLLTLIVSFANIAITLYFVWFTPKPDYGSTLANIGWGFGINGIIIYYLQKPSVKRYFGRIRKGSV